MENTPNKTVEPNAKKMATDLRTKMEIFNAIETLVKNKLVSKGRAYAMKEEYRELVEWNQKHPQKEVN